MHSGNCRSGRAEVTEEQSPGFNKACAGRSGLRHTSPSGRATASNPSSEGGTGADDASSNHPGALTLKKSVKHRSCGRRTEIDQNITAKNHVGLLCAAVSRWIGVCDEIQCRKFNHAADSRLQLIEVIPWCQPATRNGRRFTAQRPRTIDSPAGACDRGLRKIGRQNPAVQ